MKSCIYFVSSLVMFSQEFNDVCLGHLFTYRDFQGIHCTPHTYLYLNTLFKLAKLTFLMCYVQYNNYYILDFVHNMMLAHCFISSSLPSSTLIMFCSVFSVHNISSYSIRRYNYRYLPAVMCIAMTPRSRKLQQTIYFLVVKEERKNE